MPPIAKIPLCFVYAPPKERGRFGRARNDRLRGSDLLRLQLGPLVAPHLPAHIELRFSGLGKHKLAFEAWLPFQRRAVFVLTKHVAQRLTPEQIGRMRAKAIAVGVDHKDGDLSEIDFSRFDFHLGASLRGLRALQGRLAEGGPSLSSLPPPPFAELLWQAPDLRINALRFRVLDRLSAVYVGRRDHAAISSSLAAQVTRFEVRKGHEMVPVLQRLPDFASPPLAGSRPSAPAPPGK